MFYHEHFKRFSSNTCCERKSRLVSLDAIPTGSPTPFVNAAIKIPPVITADVIGPVSMMLVLVLNCFIVFASRSRTSISLRKVSITKEFRRILFI